MCELDVDTHSDVSDYSDNESLDSDSDKKLQTGPLTPQFPHPFFLTSIKTIFITVRLAQTLLDRNMRVSSTMRANRGIPRDLEGKSAFRRNGDVMVQVWKDKTCANDKYDP